MKAVERHIEEIKKYQAIVNKSDNPYIITDYSKAICRLKRELKTYCKFKGFNYNNLMKKAGLSTNGSISRLVDGRKFN